MSVIVFWFALLVMILGALGTFLPVLPGTPLIFLSALSYGFYEGFNKITPLTLGILFFLMLITLIIDYISGIIGAKKYGATKYGTWGSFIGVIIGFIFFSIPGLLLGPFIGAAAGEMFSGRELQDALKVGLGTVVGMAGGAIFKITFAIAMIAVFITGVI